MLFYGNKGQLNQRCNTTVKITTLYSKYIIMQNKTFNLSEKNLTVKKMVKKR
jgi:hypothetical protein